MRLGGAQMTVRLAALLGNFAKSLLLCIVQDHLRMESISFEDKQRGLMGITFLLHWVHLRPAVLGAENLTVCIATRRQNTSLQCVTKHWVR